MKRIIMLMLWVWPLANYAQNIGEVNFTQFTDWKVVLQKAKAEHKYIFVDAYTTWCGPCKQMDKEVYINRKVADIVNAQFISIKVQMDSTKLDKEYIKSWRKELPFFQKYVSAYPTFLFFSEDGDLIGKDEGYNEPEKFISIIKKVIDPNSGYLAQLKAYRTRTLNDPYSYINLALTSKAYKQDVLATDIAIAYKKKYIDIEPATIILKPQIIEFLKQFNPIFALDDPFNDFIFNNQNLVDKEVNFNGFSQLYIEFLIKRDLFLSIKNEKGVVITDHPDWRQIEKNLASKFNETTAKRMVRAQKIYYYKEKKDWDNAAKYEFEQIDVNGIDIDNDMSLTAVNDMIFFSVFPRDVTKKTLDKAISYMQLIIKQRPKNYRFIDTYAGVLYKAGYKAKAIAQQEFALDLAKIEKDLEMTDLFETTLKKMKENKPTW